MVVRAELQKRTGRRDDRSCGRDGGPVEWARAWRRTRRLAVRRTFNGGARGAVGGGLVDGRNAAASGPVETDGRSAAAREGPGGGGGGTTTCTNTTTDALNCGSCGHSCLGGACSGAICQPLLLGTVHSANDYAWETVVSGGQVYVFTGEGQNQPSNVWKTDASTPGTPTEVKTERFRRLPHEWAGILSDHEWPECHRFVHALELCCHDLPDRHAEQRNLLRGTCQGATRRMARSYGRAPRTLISTRSDEHLRRALTLERLRRFSFPITLGSFVDQGFSPGEVNRIFFMHNDGTSGSAFLYYIATNIVNATVSWSQRFRIAEYSTQHLAVCKLSWPTIRSF